MIVSKSISFQKIPKTKERSISTSVDAQNWFIKHDELIHDASQDGNNLITFGNITWRDYDFEFEAMALDEVPYSIHQVAAAVRAIYARGNVLVGLQCGKVSNIAEIRCWSAAAGSLLNPSHGNAQAVPTGQWATVKIQVRGEWFKLYWNGKLVAQLMQTHNPTGAVTLRSYGVSAKFRKIRVTSPDGKLLCDMGDLKEAMDAYVKVFGEN